MSSLRVTSLRGRTAGTAPTLPDGAVVTGVTTSTSAVIGVGVTINETGINVSAGIVTAFCTKVGAAVTINPSGIDAISGIVTANTLKGTTGTFSGTVTANAFSGDGGDLTGLNIPAGFTELDAALFN